MADDVERTEDPTPRRREEARRKGQLAVSQEVFTVANLLAVTLALMTLGHTALREAALRVPRLLERPDYFTPDAAIALLRTAFGAGVVILTPILLAAAAAAVLGGLAQTRGNVSVEKLKPKLSKLNPLTNAKRIFKAQGPIELPKSLLKLGVVALAIGYAVYAHLQDYVGLSKLTPLPIAMFQLSVVLKAYLAGSLALIVVALIDYAYQFWRTEKSLKMSRNEVKDEMRQHQGDPLVRARQQSLQFERARARMMSAVPEADVVVTNPEHISVALRYQRERMPAPVVVAKGGGFLAFRIREVARAAGVPVVENRPLARALYRSVKVGQAVPERLFQVVAEVLAYVYRLDRRRAARW